MADTFTFGLKDSKTFGRRRSGNDSMCTWSHINSKTEYYIHFI
jgi:hypothetical protein